MLVPLCVSLPSLFLFVSLSLPHLCFFFLFSPNQEIWPLTFQLNAIKLLSMVQLVLPWKRQHGVTQSDICLFFSVLSSQLSADWKTLRLYTYIIWLVSFTLVFSGRRKVMMYWFNAMDLLFVHTPPNKPAVHSYLLLNLFCHLPASKGLWVIKVV